ncbi:MULTISPECIES: hypothetical protein [Gloeobacter]|uniref:hypothetical protein n=1 Tax=Gloeobacter TaxID=33071 RepID=UPI0002DCB876|nr:MULTISPECIES: hypothetical protein [Gloeobacter]
MSTPLHPHNPIEAAGEIGGYVAHLQLHMALQARKLLPSALDTSNHCHNLLYQSQAEYEKFISRHRP